MQSRHWCMRTWRLETTSTESVTLVMRAALSTMPQMIRLRLTFTTVREADGRVRSDRSITLRSIFSMDTGEERPIADDGGMTWSSDLDDIFKEAGAVEDAGSQGGFGEEAPLAGSGGGVIGFDKPVGEFGDTGLKSAGPVEDSATSRIEGDGGSTTVRFAAAFDGRFLNVNFRLGAWPSSLCRNE